MAALRASKLVCSAMSLTVAMISPMAWACSASMRMLSAVDSTWSLSFSRASMAPSTAFRPAWPISRVCWTASLTPLARWATWSDVCLTWLTVMTVSEMAAACSWAPVACCEVLDRISAPVAESRATVSLMLSNAFRLRSVISWTVPMKTRSSAWRISVTRSAMANLVPSLRRPSTSRSRPMILASPVRR